jgi:zinc transport system substrate-binding protein
MPSRRLLPLVTLSAAALVLSACGTTDTSPEDATAEPGQDGLDVVVGFYPLEFATARIVGDLATVQTLTSPGVDPHDVELSPRSVASMQSADLVIHSSGLQAAVDEAVAQQAADHSLDVNEAADLVDTGGADDHDHDHADDDHADDEHADDEHADDDHADDDHADDDHAEDEHAHGDEDPHFWLDPQRMATVSQAIADRLAEVDPDNAAAYQDNAEALLGELTDLDAAYSEGLSSCEQEDMVTTHSAFGYVALNHGFHQIGITGVTPDAEPSAARLAEITEIVRETGVDTIYAEVLLGADIAETVAGETGAQVLVLDPLEGITDASPGTDYLEVMEANLDVLREGQHCA